MEDSDDRQYRQIVKYTGFFGGVQGLNILAALVRNKIAAVLLGPAGLGLISLYNAAVKFLGDTTGLGVPVSSVRYISEIADSGERARMIATVRLWSLLTAALGFLACCALAPLLSATYFDTTANWTNFLWLAPVVALTALSSGELSVLKGLHRMKDVAVQSVANALLCLAVTLPLFWAFGYDGILPALLAAALVAMGSVAWLSLRAVPYRLPSSLRKAVAAGGGMVRLGVAFVIAGALGSGVELAIRAYIAHSGTIADVGLYNSGYVITVTYASIVFMSMETDYFPRLSAVNHDVVKSNLTVNRQMEVSVLLLAPMLVAFMLALPIVIPMLYSSTFLPALGMVRLGVLAMMLRAVMLPMEYLSLAKGRSWIYLLSETAYDAVAVGAVMGGYHLWGIDGAGAGLLVAGAANCIVDLAICRHFYGYRLGRKALTLFAVQMLAVAASYAVSTVCDGIAYWLLGVLTLGVSALISYRMLEKEAGVVSALVAKFKRKMK